MSSLSPTDHPNSRETILRVVLFCFGTPVTSHEMRVGTPNPPWYPPAPSVVVIITTKLFFSEKCNISFDLFFNHSQWVKGVNNSQNHYEPLTLTSSFEKADTSLMFLLGSSFETPNLISVLTSIHSMYYLLYYKIIFLWPPIVYETSSRMEWAF